MGLWFKQIQKTQVSRAESRQCERLEKTFIVKYAWTFFSPTIEANSYGGYLWAHILHMLLRNVWPSEWKRCQDTHQLVVVSAVLFNELGLHFSTTRVLWSPINNLRKKIIFTGCFHHIYYPFIVMTFHSSKKNLLKCTWCGTKPLCAFYTYSIFCRMCVFWKHRFFKEASK